MVLMPYSARGNTNLQCGSLYHPYRLRGATEREAVTVTARTNASEPKLERMLYYEDTKLRSRR